MRSAGRPSFRPSVHSRDDHRRELEEVEELRHRLAELEERVDFAERTLSREQEPAAARTSDN